MKNTSSANNWTVKNQKRYYNIALWDYHTIDFYPPEWSLVYLYGDLWMWKTTLTQIFLSKLLQGKYVITSPTYTYYNTYELHYYHFDLYRLSSYDEFFQIGGEDILLGRNKGCIFVEWPDRIDTYIKPDYTIHITTWKDKTSRDIVITPLYLS